MATQTQHLESIGHICATLQKPYGDIRRALADVGAEPAMVLNGVAHYAEADVGTSHAPATIEMRNTWSGLWAELRTTEGPIHIAQCCSLPYAVRAKHLDNELRPHDLRTGRVISMAYDLVNTGAGVSVVANQGSNDLDAVALHRARAT